MEQLTEEQAQEELHPELARCISDGSFGPILRHPLVYCALYDETQAWRCNRALEHKSALLTDAVRQKRWQKAVMLHEKPYRLDALLQIAERMEDRDYWHLLGDVWTGTEIVHFNYDLWLGAFCNPRPGRPWLMSSEEQNELASLPDRVELYRGFDHPDAARGLSWTLDRGLAEWFARRLYDGTGTPTVASASVRREHIIAYFAGRSEQEVLVNPDWVGVDELSQVPVS